MRSILAILIFLLATTLIIFSQARAQPQTILEPPTPPSCGTCGRANPYVKFCGKLRRDLIYSKNTVDAVKPEHKAQVELCVDLVEGGYRCGVSSDPLLITTLSAMLSLGTDRLCMKVDASTEPQEIVLIQGQ
ncbi:MAG: hypothetical protein ACXVCY_04770 [Pseudobdellovibrionaceae bacterium]